MTTITIDVTAADIAAGKPNCCRRCPIALAIQRAVHLDCEVDSDRIRLEAGEWDELRTAAVRSPCAVAEFVSLFDYEDTRALCLPFTFTLTIPEELTA